jgi:hypothetical protein
MSSYFRIQNGRGKALALEGKSLSMGLFMGTLLFGRVDELRDLRRLCDDHKETMTRSLVCTNSWNANVVKLTCLLTSCDLSWPVVL